MPVMTENDLLDLLRQHIDQLLRNDRQPGETAAQHFRRILKQLITTNHGGFGAKILKQLDDYFDDEAVQDTVWDTGRKVLHHNSDGSWTAEVSLQDLDSTLKEACDDGYKQGLGDFIANLMVPWSRFREAEAEELFYDWLEEVGFGVVES